MKLFFLFFRKDLLYYTRSWEPLLSLVFFVVLCELIFYFSFGPLFSPRLQPSFVMPLVWVPVFFGGMLCVSRTFEAENEGRVLDAFCLLPQTIVPFFLGKFFLNGLLILFLEIFSLCLGVFLFNLELSGEFFFPLLILFLVGGFGFACVGTAFSAMLVGKPKQEIILPLLCYPMLAPLLLGVLHGMEFAADGGFLGLDQAWISLLVGFDGVTFLISLFSFKLLME